VKRDLRFELRKGEKIMGKKVVIIGCGGTGGPCAVMAKKLDPSMDITIIREEENFLTRCATPYISVGDTTVDQSVKDDSIFFASGIKLVQDRVTKINRNNKTVTTASGEVFPYDKLVFATGARAVAPPIPGVDLKGIFLLRTSRDSVNILDWINRRRVREATVVGAGAIGIEMAYLMATRGINITLVEMLDHVLPISLDQDMADPIEEYMKEKGIDLRVKEKLTRIEGNERVEGIQLSSGEKKEADIVILSAGVRTNIELAMEAGLEIGERNGVKVNRYLQTSDPDIYAAGDVIEYEHFITGRPSLGQVRPNAVIGGRIIAKNIVGYQVEFPPILNNFVTKFFEKSVASTGLTESAAKKEGLEVIATKNTSRSKHIMIEGWKPYTVKLVFDKNSKNIIGGQILSDSDCMVKQIDVITLAIRSRMTALDMTTIRNAGQPELSSEPSAEPITIASEEAFRQLYPIS